MGEGPHSQGWGLRLRPGQVFVCSMLAGKTGGRLGAGRKREMRWASPHSQGWGLRLRPGQVLVCSMLAGKTGGR